MKVLPLRPPKDKIDGFIVEILRREDRIVLARKRLPNLTEFRNFEVMVVQVGKIHPKSVDLIAQGWTHAERLPGTSQWGSYGWTFIELEKAEQAFTEALAGYRAHVAKHGEHFSDEMIEPESDEVMPEPDMVDPEFMPEPEEMPEP